jgi:hypothetical protein
MTIENLVIVGAPRSGTNMLRDVLTSLEGIGTWPCDEINYIWRHGNVRYPSDELPRENATPSTQRYIKKQFQWVANTYDVDIVVEKTCANCLRIPFVHEVLPSAKYIYIYRDGIDAIGSARLRWTAKLDIPYLLEKVRFVPRLDLPYYAFRYFWSRVYRVFSSEKRLAFWGPKLHDMEEVIKKRTLNEVCAIQWQRCVDQADAALSAMPEGKVIRVKYEDFVSCPREELSRILLFLGYQLTSEVIAEAVAGVSNKSLGKGRAALGAEDVRRLEALVGASLKRYGYL